MSRGDSQLRTSGFRLVLRGRRLGRELQHAAEDTQDPARGATRLGPALDQDQVLVTGNLHHFPSSQDQSPLAAATHEVNIHTECQ